MNSDKITPENKEEIEQHVKMLDKHLGIYIICLGLSFALPIIQLAIIYTIDFLKFDIVSFILIIASIFIFYEAFKGASLTARELVIYENML